MSNPDTDSNFDWQKLSALSEADELAAIEARGEKLKATLRKHQAQLPVLEQVADLGAKMKFVNYQALVRSGFTPEQAMFLIVNRK